MELLKQLRIGNHLTQEDLGHLLHVSQQTIQKWESGKCKIPISYHKQLADLLCVDVDFFKYDISEDDFDFTQNIEVMKQQIESINSAKSFMNFCKIYSNRKKAKQGIISNGIDIFKFTSVKLVNHRKAVLFEDSYSNCVPLISNDIIEVQHLSGEYNIQHFEIKIKVPVFPDKSPERNGKVHSYKIAFFYE